MAVPAGSASSAPSSALQRSGGYLIIAPVLRRANRLFLVLVLLQALHSVEEYAFRFYEIFPPARYLNRLFPGIARPGFIIFNALLIVFGLAGWRYAMQPDRGGARAVVWIWVVIELYNGVAHIVWAIMIGGYNPGLYSAPALALVAGWLGYVMYSTRLAPGSQRRNLRGGPHPGIPERTPTGRNFSKCFAGPNRHVVRTELLG